MSSVLCVFCSKYFYLQVCQHLSIDENKNINNVCTYSLIINYQIIVCLRSVVDNVSDFCTEDIEFESNKVSTHFFFIICILYFVIYITLSRVSK